ncbi:hypothetical protein Tco_0058416 [Tanacetum coccineum]
MHVGASCTLCAIIAYDVATPAFFSALRSMNYDQLYTDLNVGVARQICLGSEVRSRAEHELELKEKLNANNLSTCCASEGHGELASGTVQSLWPSLRHTDDSPSRLGGGNFIPPT